MKRRDLVPAAVGDLRFGLSGFFRKVASTGRPLPVTLYHRAYLHVVPSELWREAEQALLEKRAREKAERRAERRAREQREAVPV